jgi:hypothetical protein
MPRTWWVWDGERGYHTGPDYGYTFDRQQRSNFHPTQLDRDNAFMRVPDPRLVSSSSEVSDAS